MPNLTKIGLTVWISIINEYIYFVLYILDNAVSHYAECHYAECRYAECRGAVEGVNENTRVD
jgi:hypothetical protein